MESRAERIIESDPKRTSLRDALVASLREWKSRLVPIVREVTGSEDVEKFLQEKPKCSFENVQRLTPMVKALNEIAIILKELSAGKTEQDLRATYGDMFREHAMRGVLIENVVEVNKQWQREFFGRVYEMPPLPEAVTLERMKRWEELHFELRYLPPERMTEDRTFPGWKKKPQPIKGSSDVNLFQKAKQIQNLLRNKFNSNLQGLSPLDLPGCWVLIDTRPKPDFDQGEQEYDDDEEIQKIIQGKRNSIDPKEFLVPRFWKGIKQLLLLGDDSSATIRLPRLIEQNVLGQGPEWDGTTTFEWAEEWEYKTQRLASGRANDWGYMSIISDAMSAQNIGFRPMVVFN